MRLTKHTDYAFRVLIYLASMPEDRLSTVQEIAERFGVSRSHVMKIVQKLAGAGLIQASRGQHGGIRLGKPKHSINLRQVIELMEATLAPVNCEDPVCIILQGCALKTILFEAQHAFLQHVERYTLADLAEPAVSIVHFLKRDN
ncbi:MAG TPA: Rrf2 family transcriptional regulator [Thiobacillus sp.]|nr:MAG: BadM/Rrf2 family transcriptional regulator [Hydrogenophilales bacterium 28-61-11]OYZ58428.1 MAG: BadM/Rrf2 family transcriptional regulator [Hydrogenophilales bacterium 16-61-112]OZA45921.1 MAG: BadM/Rrf2 family transcriptional regulator [Hydrogenophilales bacterium 17-61-76]HQT29677.1 Rrf2 family transcriptional regulator [Thiobacillus sp.]HQT70187.1 Rrf2 family transcriptional regulator [Thiobacillus sp.]